MNFGEAEIRALFSQVTSKAEALGAFDRVSGHEPLSKPGTGLSYAVTGAVIRAITSSGLASVSGVVTLSSRIYIGRSHKPEDGIDPKIIAAGCLLMGAFAGGFTFGGTVREVDLLGQFGQPLECRLGWMEQEGQLFRVGEMPIPVVVDDMFTEAA